MAKLDNFNAALVVADTFWRIFVPVGLLIAGGIWLDDKTGHEQLFVLIGLAAGFVVAGLLIRAQYRHNN